MSKQGRVEEHLCDRCRALFFKPRAEEGEFVPVGSSAPGGKEGRERDWAYRRITEDTEVVPQSVCDDAECRFGTTWGQLAYQTFTQKRLRGIVDRVLREGEDRDGGEAAP